MLLLFFCSALENTLRLLPRLSASSRLSQAPPYLSTCPCFLFSSFQWCPDFQFLFLLSCPNLKTSKLCETNWKVFSWLTIILLSSHFLINCLHLACLPDLGHDSMGFVQMENLLPQQYRLLNWSENKVYQNVCNSINLESIFQSIISLFSFIWRVICRTLQSMRERKYWRSWNFYRLCMQIKLHL